MEEYEKPHMEIVEIEEELRTCDFLYGSLCDGDTCVLTPGQECPTGGLRS